MSVTAAAEYGRGVVRFRPVLGALLLATSAGLLREALDTTDIPGRAVTALGRPDICGSRNPPVGLLRLVSEYSWCMLGLGLSSDDLAPKLPWMGIDAARWTRKAFPPERYAQLAVRRLL